MEKIKRNVFHSIGRTGSSKEVKDGKAEEPLLPASTKGNKKDKKRSNENLVVDGIDEAVLW